MLLFLTLALVAFGLIMVFSASSMSAAYHMEGDSLYYTKKQALGIALGLGGMIVCMNLRYDKLKKWALPFFFVVLVSLFLVPFIGHEAKGAKSWFKIGPLQLQPAEFAKLGIILYLSSLISKKQDKFSDFQKGLLPALIMVGFVAFLIMLQPDFGSTMILCMGAMLVIVVGGANLKHLGLLGAGIGGLGVLYVAFKFITKPDFASGYQVARITSFLDPWADPRGDGFHIVQSLYAFGHGGFMGAGFGQSIQKLHFLPAPHNDFIFSIIGEELGFIGSAFFLMCYLLFIWRGFIVSLRCKDTFGSLAGVGIMGMIGIQALINLGGVTNSIPLTGVTLPLISYGGSSILITLTSLGILLGISREQNREIAEAEAGSKQRAVARKRPVTG